MEAFAPPTGSGGPELESELLEEVDEKLYHYYEGKRAATDSAERKLGEFAGCCLRVVAQTEGRNLCLACL